MGDKNSRRMSTAWVACQYHAYDAGKRDHEDRGRQLTQHTPRVGDMPGRGQHCGDWMPTVTAKQSGLRSAPTADYQYDLPGSARLRNAHRGEEEEKEEEEEEEGVRRRIRHWSSHRLVEVVHIWLAI